MSAKTYTVIAYSNNSLFIPKEVADGSKLSKVESQRLANSYVKAGLADKAEVVQSVLICNG